MLTLAYSSGKCNLSDSSDEAQLSSSLLLLYRVGVKIVPKHTYKRSYKRSWTC